MSVDTCEPCFAGETVFPAEQAAFQKGLSLHVVSLSPHFSFPGGRPGQRSPGYRAVSLAADPPCQKEDYHDYLARGFSLSLFHFLAPTQNVISLRWVPRLIPEKPLRSPFETPVRGAGGGEEGLTLA